MKSRKTIPIFHSLAGLYTTFLVILIQSDAAEISEAPEQSHKVPALFVFGDSIMDTGNNNYFTTFTKSNYKPYGRDFPGGKPTGRFSNGKLPADFFADKFGVKRTLPAYLDPKLLPRDLLTGVSFASAGSGYDPLSSKFTKALTLEDQLDMFKDYTEKLKKRVGGTKATEILKQSIFLVASGSNDIGLNYYWFPNRKNKYNIEQYTDMMISSASKFLKGLLKLGARRIGVINIPPMGCVPIQRSAHGGFARKCFDVANQGSLIFNCKLMSLLKNFNKTNPEARLVNIDMYTPLRSYIQQPSRYGFIVTTKACCGLGNIESGPFCNSLQPKICEHDARFVFWDGYHPTQRAFQLFTDRSIKKNMHKFF